MDAVVEAGGLDRALATEWSLARVLDYRLWAMEEGFTEDPERWGRLAEWLSRR